MSSQGHPNLRRPAEPQTWSLMLSQNPCLNSVHRKPSRWGPSRESHGPGPCFQDVHYKHLVRNCSRLRVPVWPELPPNNNHFS